MRQAWNSIHPDCQCSACSIISQATFFFTISRSPDLYTCFDVNDVLTFCDFTLSYCSLLMRASAWKTKGNTVEKKADVYDMPQSDIIFRTINPWVIVRTVGRGREGSKLEYLRIRVGPKAAYTHRKVYTQRALQPFMYYRRASYCLAIPNSFRHYYEK